MLGMRCRAGDAAIAEHAWQLRYVPAGRDSMPMQRRLPPQVVQCVSSGSFVTVRQQSLCRTHAQAQRCPWVIHQRQQPLQRVVCLRQAKYQAGSVAAASRPSSARTCAPCVLSCASAAPFDSGHLLNTFNGGVFSARGELRVSAGLGLQTLNAPHPRNFFSVRLASCGGTVGLHTGGSGFDGPPRSVLSQLADKLALAWVAHPCRKPGHALRCGGSFTGSSLLFVKLNG